MKYIPGYNPKFIKEDTFEKDFELLEDKLKGYQNKGRLKSFDGLELEYEYYLAEKATATVIIVHGYTEFIRKYREMCGFLLDMGYNVFVYDQRGHGKSGRETKSMTVAHVSSFDAYVKDLEKIIDCLVLPQTSVPIYAFSHSMGGGVLGLYMQKHPQTIKKAILCAPMICPKTKNVPKILMKYVLKRDALKNGYDAPFIGAKKFDARDIIELSNDQSRGRYKMNMATRISDICYQNSEITNGWLLEALHLQKRLLNKKTKQIKTKVLILSAEKDTVVNTKAQTLFFKKLTSAKMQVLKDAKHNIFNGSEFILAEAYSLTKEFFEN